MAFIIVFTLVLAIILNIWLRPEKETNQHEANMPQSDTPMVFDDNCTEESLYTYIKELLISEAYSIYIDPENGNIIIPCSSSSDNENYYIVIGFSNNASIIDFTVHSFNNIRNERMSAAAEILTRLNPHIDPVQYQLSYEERVIYMLTRIFRQSQPLTPSLFRDAIQHIQACRRCFNKGLASVIIGDEEPVIAMIGMRMG